MICADDYSRLYLKSGKAEIVDGLVVDLSVLKDGKDKDEKRKKYGESVSEKRDHVNESHSTHEGSWDGVILKSQDEDVVIAE